MNSVTPLCAHPFAYLGIIQEEGHLRTLKVTALCIVALDTHETTRKTWKHTSAFKFTSQFTYFKIESIHLYCTFWLYSSALDFK